jgi:hypothetical protein
MSGIELETVSTVSGGHVSQRACVLARMGKPLKRLYSARHANTGLKPGANQKIEVLRFVGSLGAVHQSRQKAELQTDTQSVIENRQSKI